MTCNNFMEIKKKINQTTRECIATVKQRPSKQLSSIIITLDPWTPCSTALTQCGNTGCWHWPPITAFIFVFPLNLWNESIINSREGNWAPAPTRVCAIHTCRSAKCFLIDCTEWLSPTPTCHHQEYHGRWTSMDLLHQDRKSLWAPIDLNHPPPAHQLLVTVKLTGVVYRARNWTPQPTEVNCSCLDLFKKKKQTCGYFIWLPQFQWQQRLENSEQELQTGCFFADMETTEIAGMLF